MNNLLTTEQLKKLITDHSLSENLKILIKQSQAISELAIKLREQANKLLGEELEVLNQTQFLKDLEQLRISKHYLRGIRLINFHEALKGEIPRYPTTPPFDAKSWEEARRRKIARIKEQKEKENA